MTRPSDDACERCPVRAMTRPSYDRPYDAATRSQSREVRRGRAPRHPASRTGRGCGNLSGGGRAVRLPTVWLRRAATTVQDLTAAETANAAARSDDAIVAAAGALAAVLGSVAASEAVHATVLATVLATVPATGPGPGTPPASVPATVPGAGHSAVTDVDVLQTLLATENAAAYGYGVLGGRLGSDERTVASQAENAHLARRDAVARLVRDRGVSPTPAAPGYVVPGPVADRTAALTLAARLEDGAAAASSSRAALGVAASP